MPNDCHTVRDQNGEQIELRVLRSEVWIGDERFSAGDLYSLEIRRESPGDRVLLSAFSVLAFVAGALKNVPLAVVAVTCLVGSLLHTRLRSSRWVVSQMRGQTADKYLFRADTAADADRLARLIEEAMNVESASS